MNKYRIISLLLILVMLFGMIPAATARETSTEETKKLTVVSAASSSNAASDFSPNKLVDGITDNFWSSVGYSSASPGSPDYFDLSFTWDATLTEVRLMPRMLNGAPVCFPTAFKFQYSLNGSAWADIPGASWSGYQSNAEWQIFKLPTAVEADRFRMVATTYGADDFNNYYFQLSEVEIYGETEVVEVPDSQVLSIIDYASSDTAAADFSAANLVDGDYSTFWSTTLSSSASPASPGYFDLVLPWASGITAVQLMPRMFNGAPMCFPTAFKFQYSLGGSAWADIPGASWSGYQPTGEWQTFQLPVTVEADKIRMVSTGYGADDFNNRYSQIAEVQVLGYPTTDVETKAFGETYYYSDAAYTAGMTESTSVSLKGNTWTGDPVYVGCEDNDSRITFVNVDFGDGQALSLKMSVAGWYDNIRHFRWEDAVLDVYLDNRAGDPIAKIYIHYDEDAYDQTIHFAEYDGALSKTISGVHNVVIDFRGNWASFQWMRLSTEEAAPNVIEQMEQEYLANKPDMNQLTDMMSDTWGGTDLLGRKIETNETGESTYEEDKIVGMFMWNWHIRYEDSHNVEEILKTSGSLDGYPAGNGEGQWFWGEPVYGYYNSYDPWVIRQQGELLADAGVDVLFFDATNGDWAFMSAYLEFFEVYNEIMKSGADMPKLSFMLPFGISENTTRDLISLYETIYEKGLYQESWFYWDGKPLILNGPSSNTPSHIKDFFSFKMITSTYVNSVSNPTNNWAWLELYPQNQYVDSQGRSFMTVGVAQNHNGSRLCAMNAGDDVLGRTTTRNADGSFTRHTEEGALLKGYNFQQQFDRAIETDTDFIFITGWNEWVASRYDNWNGTNMAHPDQYNPEYSRDIEPSKGVLKDVYYTQLVENVRRFKGTRPVPMVEEAMTVCVDGAFGDWADANTYYTYVNNIQDRDAHGYPGYYYTNTSGRNDLTLAKATMDGKYAYFYVQTMDDMVGMNEESFMQLFLNVDRDVETGWEGYDFMLNRTAPTADTMTLERCTGGFNWEKAADISYVINGNELELAIPLDVLGISAEGANMEFKWMDNVLDMENPDIMDIYTEGDAAPGSRFNYILKAGEGMNTVADQKAAEAVDALIEAIGEVTLNSKAAIDEARAAYTALAEAQKVYVTGLAALEAAEVRYAELVAAAEQEAADKAAAAAVDAKIATIGEVTLNSKAAIDEARAAYTALTEAQKAYVTGLAALEAAEARYAELVAAAEQEAADKAAAAAVDAKIAAIVVEDEASVQAAREAYDALTDEQKALVTKLADLEAAELYWNTVNNEVSLVLSGADSINAFDETVIYTLSGKGMHNLATLAIAVEIPGEYLSEPAAAPADGWMIVAQVWKDGVLHVVAANNDGANGDGEILTITAKVLEKAGTTTVAVTSAEMGAYLGEDDETFVKADLSAASVTTVVEYNVYDVNKDGEVNLLDITRAQRWYGSYHADADVNKDDAVDIDDLILILNNYTDLFQ